MPYRAVPGRAGGSRAGRTPQLTRCPRSTPGLTCQPLEPRSPRGERYRGAPRRRGGRAGRRPAALRGNCAETARPRRGVWGLLQVSGGAQVVPGLRGSPEQGRGQVEGGGLTGGAFRPAGKSMVSEQEDEVQAAKVGGGRFRLTTEEKRDSSH